MDLTNRQIWMFREMRSGSDWVWQVFEKLSKRTCIQYSKETKIVLRDSTKVNNLFFSGKDPCVVLRENVELLTDATKFYSTHYFHILPNIGHLDNPYLIRTTRRNKAEHCMSLLYFNLYGNRFHHVYANNDLNVNYNFFLETLNNPITVLKQQVKETMLSMKKWDVHWDNQSKYYDNHVIVYEDLFEGVVLPNFNMVLKFSDHPEFVQKTPNYKEKFFLNYSQIVEWCKYYEQEFEFKQY